ncbi:MAG: RDD family protein [Kangiellaceae bacterium]
MEEYFAKLALNFGGKTINHIINMNQSATQVTLASFWKRLFAWIYDLLGALGIFVLALAVGQTFIYLVTLPWFSEFNDVALATSTNILWAAYLFGTVQFYYVWCWVKGGQTVGMKTWRLQVYKANGELLSYKEAYLRSFLSFGGISSMWALIDKEKRGLQDLLVDSRVVELPKDFYKNQNQKPLI